MFIAHPNIIKQILANKKIFCSSLEKKIILWLLRDYKLYFKFIKSSIRRKTWHFVLVSKDNIQDDFISQLKGVQVLSKVLNWFEIITGTVVYICLFCRFLILIRLNFNYTQKKIRLIQTYFSGKVV